MLLALRSLYEQTAGAMAGVAAGVASASATLLGDGALAAQADGTSTATLTTTVIGATGGGGFWHVGPLGIPPYTFPQPVPQDANVTLTGIQLKIKVGKLKAKGVIDLTDDELLLILAAVTMTDDDERDDDFDREYAELLLSAADLFGVLAQAASCYDVLVDE